MTDTTPAANWRASGEEDPHAGQYDGERAALALGQLTDDELANAVYMGGNEPLNIERLLAKDPTYHSPIALLTAAKERIRWLSRTLEQALAQPSQESAVRGGVDVAGDRFETPVQGWQQQAEASRVPDDVFEAEFMTWWEEHGQYCRSGGGDYERTFAFQAWRHLYPKLMKACADLERICEKVRSFEQGALTASRIQGETIARLRRERDQALAGQLPQAWLDVHAERRRQVEEEAFDPCHDDAATRGQLARAAGCYALHAGGVGTNWPEGIGNGCALFWPWDKGWWKPKTPRETLIRAGALIFAELERLDRAAASAQERE